MKRESIRALTYGAIIGALYAVMLLLVKSFGEVDSIFYFIIPIPIAVYGYLYKPSYLGIAIICYSIISFLIVDVYIALLAAIPHVILGGLLALLFKTKLNHGVKGLILIVFSLVFDILSSYVFFKVYGYNPKEGYDYLLKFISKDMLDLILNITIPSVYFLYSMIKIIFIYIMFVMLLKRLNLLSKDYIIRFKNKRIYSIATLVLFIIFIPVFILYIKYSNKFLLVLTVIVLSVLSILSLIMLYFGLIHLMIITNIRNQVLRIIFIIFMLILFPAPIFTGIITGFLYSEPIKNSVY